MTEYARLHSGQRYETRQRAISFLEQELRRAPRSEFGSIEQQLDLLKRDYSTEHRDMPSTAPSRLPAALTSIDAAGESFAGYAAKFNSLSKDLGGFREIIKPGAFRKAITSSPDIKFLVDHDPDRMLARSSAKTVTIFEDDYGLKFRAPISGTQLSKDIAIQVQRGDISKCSFAFVVGKDSFTRQSTGIVREITEVRLLKDVSAAADPAYDGTSVTLASTRSLRDDDGLFARLQKLNGKSSPRMSVQEARLKILELQQGAYV